MLIKISFDLKDVLTSLFAFRPTITTKRNHVYEWCEVNFSLFYIHSYLADPAPFKFILPQHCNITFELNEMHLFLNLLS